MVIKCEGKGSEGSVLSDSVITTHSVGSAAQSLLPKAAQKINSFPWF